MRYLKTTAPGVIALDHRLTPEVSAMFAAMSSRMPAGGIEARYMQIVEAVAEGLYNEVKQRAAGSAANWPTWPALRSGQDTSLSLTAWLRQGEDRLCEYPLHPKVQEFFDQFVLNYGHSSIMELTGQPAVYTEGVSWYTAYLLFDSPLCAGQEFSTRAVRHKDWPMAAECYFQDPNFLMGEPEMVGTIPVRNPLGVPPEAWDTSKLKPVVRPHPKLKALHNGWFEVFEAEVAWWQEHLSDAANREALGIADKEPFRPALDRARWAIPGTIATGCCHTGNLRERARVIHDGMLLAQRSENQAAITVWENIKKGYEAALPGMAGMGLREAVYDENSHIPSHLFVQEVPVGDEVRVSVYPGRELAAGAYKRSAGDRTYVDPFFNHHAQVDIAFQCSLAVCRDWHRHRTVYPWSLGIVRGRHADIERSVAERSGLFFDDGIRIHPAYQPMSDLAKEKLPGLLAATTKAFDEFMAVGDQMRAMLSLPLGTLVQMSGQAGLRDTIYTLELRGHAHGANFEYKAQALKAMELLKDQLPNRVLGVLGL